MNKHASGPWLYKAPADVMRKGLRICSVNAGIRDLTMGQQVDVAVANARLIAAAPELLEALIEAEHWVSEFVSQMSAYTISDKASESADRIRAAIAKARGES